MENFYSPAGQTEIKNSDVNPPSIDYLKVFSGKSASELPQHVEKAKQNCFLPEDLARYEKTGSWDNRDVFIYDPDVEVGELTDHLNAAQDNFIQNKNVKESWTSVGYGKFMRATFRDHSDTETHRFTTEFHFPDDFKVRVPDTDRFIPIRKITIDNSLRGNIGTPTETIIIDVADRKPSSITYRHFFTREEGVRKALQLVDEFRR